MIKNIIEKSNKISFKRYIQYLVDLEINEDIYIDGLDGIAFESKDFTLTEEGYEYFKDALNKCYYEDECIQWDNDETDDEDGIPNCAYLALEFLRSAAGYCSNEKFKKWFNK